MYCSECGTRASGKFCHKCGSRLHAPEHQQDSVVDTDVEWESDVPWEHDPRYERIVRVEAVRSAITRHSAAAPKGISGEAILEVYDKIVASPIPLATLATVVQPLYASWGIRTGKERSEVVDMPIGRTIAVALISLAKHGLPFQDAQQSDSGCQLNAELPSSICALKGSLSITLIQKGQKTAVHAATTIPGQMYDWGKSDRCLDQLLSDLRSGHDLPPGISQRSAA